MSIGLLVSFTPADLTPASRQFRGYSCNNLHKIGYCLFHLNDLRGSPCNRHFNFSGTGLVVVVDRH
jgi:hypothetical protein